MTEVKEQDKKTRSAGPERKQRPPRGPRGKRKPMREQDEFEQQLIDLARVTRVMAGGKRMRFRACMVIGDRKGKVGWGIAKGTDVAIAMQKAAAQAKKNMITVSILDGTIPHEIHIKYKAARLMLRPAKKGSGLIAGGVVRTVLALAGIQDIASKMYGSNNKVNNVAATFEALGSLRRVDTPKPAKDEKNAKPQAKQPVAKKTEKKA